MPPPATTPLPPPETTPLPPPSGATATQPLPPAPAPAPAEPVIVAKPPAAQAPEPPKVELPQVEAPKPTTPPAPAVDHAAAAAGKGAASRLKSILMSSLLFLGTGALLVYAYDSRAGIHRCVPIHHLLFLLGCGRLTRSLHEQMDDPARFHGSDQGRPRTRARDRRQDLVAQSRSGRLRQGRRATRVRGAHYTFSWLSDLKY